MRAVTFQDGAVVVATRPDPVLSEHDVAIDVVAAGLNGADLLQMKGQYPAPSGVAPDIPGLECAGIVVAVGAKVDTVSPGDRRMALLRGAGQAGRVVVDSSLTLPIPDGTAFEVAGGFCEVFATAHDALFTQIGLASSTRVLISGAAGGVGTAAVQLALSCGATVVASVRDKGRRKTVASLGPVEVIDPSETAALGPYDAVLELVGAPNLLEAIDALATFARVWVIGVGAGAKALVDLRKLMTVRARIGGSTLRARTQQERSALLNAMWKRCASGLASGKFVVPLADIFSMEEAPRAYERFQAGSKFGKVVLRRELDSMA